MRMKAIKILALVVGLAGAHGAMAASYYTITKDVTCNLNGKSVTYRCFVRGEYHVTIYNKASAKYLIDEEELNYTMKDGSPVQRDAEGWVMSMDDDLFSKEQKKAKYIVASGFSTAEKALIKGHRLHTIMAVTSDGKVTEVCFHFTTRSPYQQIPLSTFARIEASLKQQLYYHKTAIGKQMNYDIVSWTYDFSYTIPNPSPTPPSPPSSSTE